MLVSIINRTNSEDPEFLAMVQLLDKDLTARYGEQQAFFDQFNNLHVIKHTAVAYVDNKAVGCIAIKAFDESSMEVKRMFVKEDYRGKGVAPKLLNEAEAWAKEMGFQNCVLETATGQPEAIRFYHKMGYEDIENYGVYVGVENSVCMRKKLL